MFETFHNKKWDDNKVNQNYQEGNHFDQSENATAWRSQMAVLVLEMSKWRFHMCVCWVVRSCPTLCDPVECSPPGSSVPGISQTRILKWVAITFPRGSSRPRDQTRVSHVAGRVFTIWASEQTLPVGKKRSKLKCLSHTTSHLYLEPQTDIIKVLFDASWQSRRTYIWGRMVNQVISGWSWH